MKIRCFYLKTRAGHAARAFLYELFHRLKCQVICTALIHAESNWTSYVISQVFANKLEDPQWHLFQRVSDLYEDPLLIEEGAGESWSPRLRGWPICAQKLSAYFPSVRCTWHHEPSSFWDRSEPLSLENLLRSATWTKKCICRTSQY
jgi:hypothetical protein